MPVSNSNGSRYIALSVWFVIAIAFQLAISLSTLTNIWSDAHHFQVIMLRSWTLDILLRVINPFLCLLLGFYVASVRTRNRRAWLLLALLWSFSVACDGANWPDEVMAWKAPFNHLAVVYRKAATWSWPIWMISFSLYFPETADFDRRRPNLKWFLLVPAIIAGLLVTVSATLRNEVRPYNTLLSPYEDVVARLLSWFSILVFLSVFTRKLVVTRDPDERRRLRVLAAGLLISFVPQSLADSYSRFMHVPEISFPFWFTIPVVALLLLFPITLAYVTVVQRALDVRVIVRQGLQYALAKRGLIVIQIFVSLIVVLLVALLSGRMTFAQRATLTAAGIGTILIIGLGAQKLASWIDRRFFREANYAEQLLSTLADSVSSLLELPPLLTTVGTRVKEALHISEVAVFLCEQNAYRLAFASGYTERPSIEFGNSSLTVNTLQQTRQALPVYLDDPRSWITQLSKVERAELDRLGAQLLVPLTRRKELLGFLSLGRRDGEAPYTSNDMRLLQSVAQQTAVAVENTRLTTTIANEAAEREVLQRELSIAREVQQRLLPQTLPRVAGLDCFGLCRPAREVGGDYYDFLELPNQVLGLAIGDVAGKGIPASLLMASLQASLRGQTMGGCDSLERLVQNVNQLVYATSPVNRYATFFYAQYDAAQQELTYVNAGHNAPLLLRCDGGQRELVRLETGGPPVGLLPFSAYQSDTVQLRTGDLIVLFTDGVSEAMNSQEEEWGEGNLIGILQGSDNRHPETLVDEIFRAADGFAGGAPQHDDMTIVILSVTGVPG